MPLSQEVRNALTEQDTGAIARTLGLDRDRCKTLVDAIIPAVAVRVAEKAETESAANSLLDFLNRHRHELITSDSVQSALNESQDATQAAGAAMLKYLAGDSLGGTIDAISTQCSVSIATVRDGLKILTPFILGTLAGKIERDNMNGLGVKIFLLESQNIPEPAATPDPNDDLDKTESLSLEEDQFVMSRLLPWLVLLLTSLALLYFLGRGCSTTPADVESGQTGLLVDDNVLLRMQSVLESKAIPSSDPYVLDKVSFEPGTAQLTSSSFSQIDALQRLMLTYPDAQVRIEGHTDNSGDARSNLELSSQMALAVKSYLEEKGIPRDRIRALGRGHTKPVTSNSTEEGRAQNRRIEVYLTTVPQGQ